MGLSLKEKHQAVGYWDGDLFFNEFSTETKWPYKWDKIKFDSTLHEYLWKFEGEVITAGWGGVKLCHCKILFASLQEGRTERKKAGQFNQMRWQFNQIVNNHCTDSFYGHFACAVPESLSEQRYNHITCKCRAWTGHESLDVPAE